MKNIFLALCIMSMVHVGVAQSSQALNHLVYNSWNSITSPAISADGIWICYTLKPQDGDSKVVLFNSQTHTNRLFSHAESPLFTEDGQFLTFRIKPLKSTIRKATKDKIKKKDMPHDSLAIIDLRFGTMFKVGQLDKIFLPKKASAWLAYTKIKTETLLYSLTDVKKDVAKKKSKNMDDRNMVIHQLKNAREWKFSNVDEVSISDNARLIAFTTISQDSAAINGINVFNTEKEELVFEDHSALHYKQIALDEAGTKLAFLLSHDSLKTRWPVYSLAQWKSGARAYKVLVDSHSKGMYSAWGISPFATGYFSRNGQRIFFGTAPLPEPVAEDSLLEEEKASLNIWSWTDKRLQPQQLKELKADQEKNYLALFDLNKKTFRQLADLSIQKVIPGSEGDAQYAIGHDVEPYQEMQSWKSPVFKDVYLINLENGNRTLFCEKCLGNPRISPAGNYVYWFDLEQSDWLCYNIRSKKTINLTINLPVHFEYEAIDIPREAWAYGAAGWSEKDESFLVYDQYDIWKFDPDANHKPLNITLGLGREHHLVYRYLKLDKEEDFIKQETAYFSVFDLNTKASGYASFSWQPGFPPDLVLMDDFRFARFMKAKKTDAFLYTRESFNEFPDLWYSTSDFLHPEKISDANPQMRKYRWGNEHLISWINHVGDTLQGIVYEPDNLDSSTTYPLLVYFYELNSDLLHRHHVPEPRRSIIDPIYYVSNGYIVFIPDIKYRIGHPGQSALDCVNTGVDKALESGLIDSTRMGIQGQSWGGYEVAYIITQTDRFAAAMAGAPVSNMTSAYGGIRWGSGRSRMFQYENTQSRIGATLWDSLDLYIENSPLFFVPKVKTPVLIMHNDQDGAVPWYQGIEFFTALRRNQKKAWMLSYSDEKHNLSRRPNRIDLTIRMQQFFDYYLKSEPIPDWMQNGVPAIKKNEVSGWKLLNN